MGFDGSLRKEFRETVTVRPLTGIDEYGSETHGVGTQWTARVQEASTRRYLRRGDEEIREDYAVWIVPDSNGNLPTIVPGETIITMPDGTEPRVVRVLTYDNSENRGRLNHIKITVGNRVG